MPGCALAPDLVTVQPDRRVRTSEMHLAGPGRAHLSARVRDTQTTRTCQHLALTADVTLPPGWTGCPHPLPTCLSRWGLGKLAGVR